MVIVLELLGQIMEKENILAKVNREIEDLHEYKVGLWCAVSNKYRIWCVPMFIFLPDMSAATGILPDLFAKIGKLKMS